MTRKKVRGFFSHQESRRFVISPESVAQHMGSLAIHTSVKPLNGRLPKTDVPAEEAWHRGAEFLGWVPKQKER